MVVESTSLDWVLGGGQAFKAFDRTYRITLSINHAYMLKYTIVINYIPVGGRLGILYFSNTLEYHRFFPYMSFKCEPLGDLTIEPVPPNGKRFKDVIPSITFSSVAATTTFSAA
ncbi:hypothetical protein WICPIJ_002240 [Wickerhamomyces pijperi]|uniref:Uncharacterized protein n=1 Tax=Wickerhamomyces pijperi TaxID=599730 RepID=A0A9P8TPU3_WICPI|nr:hypothetical protein WICPIJ_002240 [Wickerhamomyces pijperi]